MTTIIDQLARQARYETRRADEAVRKGRSMLSVYTYRERAVALCAQAKLLEAGYDLADMPLDGTI